MASQPVKDAHRGLYNRRHSSVCHHNSCFSNHSTQSRLVRAISGTDTSPILGPQLADARQGITRLNTDGRAGLQALNLSACSIATAEGPLTGDAYRHFTKYLASLNHTLTLKDELEAEALRGPRWLCFPHNLLGPCFCSINRKKRKNALVALHAGHSVLSTLKPLTLWPTGTSGSR